MRSMVEGLTRASIQNVLENTLGIAPQFARRNSEHPVAAIPQPQVPPFIPRRIVAHLMGHAVNFDRKLRGGTIEVEDEGPGRMLMSELEPGRTPAKNLPESGFRWAHRAA